ncbi:GreA/GreB family elongation factor [bacterium]|jgi:transcription elongation factor GreA|nr:GreA/GreB family elongation factor [bacterium]
MTEDASVQAAQPSLASALSEYLETLKPAQRVASESYIRKFLDLMGHEMLCSSLTAARVESYAEAQIKDRDPNAPERVSALKGWFQFLKKKGYIPENYGARIRVRRSSHRNGLMASTRLDEPPIEMTADGLEARKQELAELQDQRPEIVRAIATAREDKDFRENAPLQAAREQLGMTDGRIKQLEADIKRAVVSDATSGDLSAIGSIVSVTRLDTFIQMQFTLVGAREANAAERRISVDSPVGKELLNRRTGDEVNVIVPSGTIIQYRIDAILPGQ